MIFPSTNFKPIQTEKNVTNEPSEKLQNNEINKASRKKSSGSDIYQPNRKISHEKNSRKSSNISDKTVNNPQNSDPKNDSLKTQSTPSDNYNGEDNDYYLYHFQELITQMKKMDPKKKLRPSKKHEINTKNYLKQKNNKTQSDVMTNMNQMIHILVNNYILQKIDDSEFNQYYTKKTSLKYFIEGVDVLLYSLPFSSLEGD